MPKVFIVDDSDQFLFIISNMLEFNDFQVNTVNNSSLALDQLNQNKYDLLILDYIMDSPNGLQLAKQIREIKGHLSLPIILLTTKSLNQEEISQVKNLNLKYIQKPVDPYELVQNVKNTIQRKNDEKN